MLATPPFWASSKKALLRANNKPPVELVVDDYPVYDRKDATVPEWVDRLMEHYF